MNVGYVHTLETPDNAVDRGTLRVSVIDRDTNQPVQNARVEVSYTADPESVLEVLDTDNARTDRGCRACCTAVRVQHGTGD